MVAPFATSAGVEPAGADPIALHADSDAEAGIALLAARLPRPLVFTNGVFDLLHAGHVDCLEAARRLGAALVVGVNSDASARRLAKGAGRPFHAQAERVRLLVGLRAVSAVVVFDDDAPLELIRRLRPDIYVKGGDYTAAALPEAGLVAGWGGRTVIVPRSRDLSTTDVVERIRRSAG